MLLLASAARAQTPKKPAAPAEPASKAVTERRYYKHTNQNDRIAEVAGRKDIYLTADMGAGALHELCLIPPAADWVSEGAPPEIEHKYLNLLWRSGYAINSALGRATGGGDTLGGCGVTAYNPSVRVSEYANFFSGFFDEAIKDASRFKSCNMSEFPATGRAKYASYGRKMFPPNAAIMETVNLLLKSKTPDTVRDALGIVRTLHDSDRFRDTVEALVKDKTLMQIVTTKHRDESPENLPLRVHAMRTLATIERTERSAKLLALIWHDEKEPVLIREHAIRAFAFVVQWPGYALNDGERRKAMHKVLYPFVVPLMGITADEYDKRDEARAKKVSELGAASECAYKLFPKEVIAAAKKGLPFPKF